MHRKNYQSNFLHSSLGLLLERLIAFVGLLMGDFPEDPSVKLDV